MSLLTNPATQSREYDYLFKLLIIGDSGCGKSSLLFRFADNLYPGNIITTVGVDFRIRTLNLNGERIKLQIWDTAGQERFRTITSTYYRGTHGVIVVYDVTNGDSFKSVKRWLEEIDENCEMVSKILVGNKSDDASSKVVLSEDAQRLANQKDIPLFEVSAKDNTGVNGMFLAITQDMLQARKKHLTEDMRRDLISLHQDGEDLQRSPRGGKGKRGGSSKSHSSCCS